MLGGHTINAFKNRGKDGGEITFVSNDKGILCLLVAVQVSDGHRVAKVGRHLKDRQGNKYLVFNQKPIIIQS